MRIAIEYPDRPDIRQLIDELDAYQKPLYPPESHHGIDMYALCQPSVLFAVARDDQRQAVGCGALVMARSFGELKRMYVSPAARGCGLGFMLLRFLESAGAAYGCTAFCLETGVLQLEAISLYERAGYVRCGPFGDYVEDPHSVFMRKSAAPPDTSPR